MPRNLENLQLIVTGPKAFRGISRAAGPASVPDGFFYDAKNCICDEPLGECRTRNGYAPLFYGTVPLMKIMPNARGQWIPPWLKPPRVIVDTTDNYALTIGAAPNDGLYVNAAHPTQNVTFYVQGTAVAGISGNYTWAYGDGNTEVGAATSVNNDYTRSGTMQVTVSALHDDGDTYDASVTIIIEKRKDPEVLCPDGSLPPCDIPPRNPTVDLKVNGSDDTVEIPAPANVTVTWNSTNCTEVYLNQVAVGRSGTSIVHVGDGGEPTSFLLVGYSAEGLQVTDLVLIDVDDGGTVIPPVYELDRTLKIVGPSVATHGEVITFTYEMWARLEPGTKKVLIKTTGDIYAQQFFEGNRYAVTSDGAGGFYDEILTFTDETSKDNSDTITMELIPNVNAYMARFRAGMVLYPDVKAAKTVYVTRPSWDIDVNLADFDGDNITQIDDHETVWQTFYLELDARYFDTTETDSTFEKNVRLTLTLDDYQPAHSGALNEVLEVTFDLIWLAEDIPSATNFEEFLEPGLIPAALWQTSDNPGKLCVECTVNLPTITPITGNDYETFQLITFTATVEES